MESQTVSVYLVVLVSLELCNSSEVPHEQLLNHLTISCQPITTLLCSQAGKAAKYLARPESAVWPSSSLEWYEDSPTD